ncbi:MAG: hypothetical protein ACK4F9_07760 [Brevinematia bacterium]
MKDLSFYVNSFLEGKISFKDLLDNFRKNNINYHSLSKKFTIRVYSNLGCFDSLILWKINSILPKYICFIHLTTKQNLEIQNIDLSDVPELVVELERIGCSYKPSVSSFISVSYLSGINPNGVFDVIDFSRLALKLLTDYFHMKDFHPKFRIGISDSDEDLALAFVSDIGLIAKVQNGEKGFEFVFGGSLGTIPRKASIIFDFVNVEDSLEKLISTLYYIKSFGRVRSKDVLVMNGIQKVVEDIQSLEPNVNISSLSFCKDVHSNNLTDVMKISKINFGVDVVFRSQKQEDKFYIQTIIDNGDIRRDFINLICFISQKFGDKRIIIDNRQNFVIPNLSKSYLREVENILKIFGVSILKEDNAFDNIVSCTSTFSCNLAIVDTKVLSHRIRDLVGKVGIKINISGCPNSSGHHHLGDIGIFTISQFRNKFRVMSIIVFGGYGANSGLPIGRAFAKIPPAILHRIVELIVSSYKSSYCFDFQSFVKKYWKDLKIKIFDYMIRHNSLDKFGNSFSVDLPKREGSFIDKIFLDLFDIEFIVYKLGKKYLNGNDFYLKMLYNIACNFVSKIPILNITSLDFPESFDDLLNKLFDIEAVVESNIEFIRNYVILEGLDEKGNSVYSW